MDTFVAKTIETIHNRPGTWSYLRIGIFRTTHGREEQLGEYVRNYPALFETFHPFALDGKHYALYSPDYTATRILELPACKDIGGEERSAGGFCPVDYFVPSFAIRDWTDTSGQTRRQRLNNPADEALQATGRTYDLADSDTGGRRAVHVRYTLVQPRTFYRFGFVAGCVWGDDSSWKLQYLDLSDADRGIIKRDDRFGYVELLDKQRLHEAIDMGDFLYDGECTNISITTRQHVDLSTGKQVDPFA